MALFHHAPHFFAVWSHASNFDLVDLPPFYTSNLDVCDRTSSAHVSVHGAMEARFKKAVESQSIFLEKCCYILLQCLESTLLFRCLWLPRPVKLQRSSRPWCHVISRQAAETIQKPQTPHITCPDCPAKLWIQVNSHPACLLTVLRQNSTVSHVTEDVCYTVGILVAISHAFLFSVNVYI